MAIYFDEQSKTFYLEGKDLSYVMGINKFGFIEHLYFGARIGREDIRYARGYSGRYANAAIPGSLDDTYDTYDKLGAEISSYGSGDYHECSVQLLYPSGHRLTEFFYESHEILAEKPAIAGMPSLRGGETLKITLKEKNSDVHALLFYTVYDDVSIVTRHMELVNGTGDKVKILRAYSFTLDLPRNDYDMLDLEGAWGRERRPERTPLHHGTSFVDSKSGASGTLNPFLGILDRDATEESGNVYGFNLVYSSSFVLKADVGTTGTTRIMGGISDFDFSWTLDAGESFATPEVVMAYSSTGLTGMSHAYHDAYRKYLINPRFVNEHRPIVINNWEATYFEFNNERLMGIIDVIEGSGINTLVLDDGWFGTRNDDHQSLGDWYVNEEKLKGGLTTIIDYCHARGMKFGLWFEPEMISPNSDLYRAHPDWAIHVPGIEPAISRYQMVLDITRPEVRDYVVGAVNGMLKNNAIDYVKWDFNRLLTENYSVKLPAERQQEMHHRYALALYDLCERIIEANPHVFFEGCAGGGGRFDPGLLRYFTQVWTSDDTDAYMRTRIQYGTSMIYPLSAQSCHTSICPNHQTGRTTPFDSRADIAHLGPTGYELDTEKMTKEEAEAVSRQVATFKEMEHLILHGDLYRMDDPYSSNYFGMSVVAKDKSEAVVTAFRALCICNDENKRIHPRGLDKDAKYEIRELGMTLTGSTIMNVGLLLPNDMEDFKTFVFHLRKV